MEVREILEIGKSLGASDIHLIVGKAPVFRVHGELIEMESVDRLMPDDCQRLIYSIINDVQQKVFEEFKIYSYASSCISCRFRHQTSPSYRHHPQRLIANSWCSTTRAHI